MNVKNSEVQTPQTLDELEPSSIKVKEARQTANIKL